MILYWGNRNNEWGYMIWTIIEKHGGVHMSINLIRTAIDAMTECDNLSICLLKINNSKKNGTSYVSREITLYPAGKLNEMVEDIAEKYLDEAKGIMNKYNDIMNYNGTAEGSIIYILDADNELINEEFPRLLEAIAKTNQELDPFEIVSQAYMIQGTVIVNGASRNVKLVCMQKPVTVLKHKFLKKDGGFEEIKEKVLSLKPFIDVVIIDSEVYFLTMSGENLFNMERAYKKICSNKISEVVDANIINDAEVFKSIASTGHNPRRFVSFNQNRMNALKSKKEREKAADRFKIPLKKGKFDITKSDDAEKLVKLLCNKGMVDPFENLPVEVTGSKKWS